MRELVKAVARGVAGMAAAPWLLSYWLRAMVLGPNRALEGSSQSLAPLPGLIGQYVRRAFLGRVLAHCDRSAVIEFGVVFSQVGARIDQRVYVGPRCHLGLVHLERDVLLAPNVHIPSGGHIHGSSSEDLRRDPEGRRALVRIGAGTWVGTSAVVMADVGRDCIVGAGAVVTRPVPDRAVVGGVPARVIRQRGDGRGDVG